MRLKKLNKRKRNIDIYKKQKKKKIKEKVILRA